MDGRAGATLAASAAGTRIGRVRMNILFIVHPLPNYVPDLLLQGLRKTLGDSVVDFPRKDALYRGILGQTYLDPVPGLMPGDSLVDRTDLDAKLAARHFDLILCDMRAFPEFFPRLRRFPVPLVLIDGEDNPQRISAAGPYIVLRRETDGCDLSIPLQMAMPTEVMDWIDKYAGEPKTHSIGFLGSRSDPARGKLLGEVARLFPDVLLQCWDKSAEWQSRDSYYRALQSCRVVLTLPGAGYDTFRYWEHAACHAAHVAQRMPILIPDDFRGGIEIARFTTVRELAGLVERILEREGEWQGYAARSRAWLRSRHTTEKRAIQTLDRIKTAFLL